MRARGADDPAGDLAAVGDQDGFEHAPSSPGGCAPQASRAQAPASVTPERAEGERRAEEQEHLPPSACRDRDRCGRSRACGTKRCTGDSQSERSSRLPATARRAAKRPRAASPWRRRECIEKHQVVDRRRCLLEAASSAAAAIRQQCRDRRSQDARGCCAAIWHRRSASQKASLRVPRRWSITAIAASPFAASPAAIRGAGLGVSAVAVSIEANAGMTSCRLHPGPSERRLRRASDLRGPPPVRARASLHVRVRRVVRPGQAPSMAARVRMTRGQLVEHRVDDSEALLRRESLAQRPTAIARTGSRISA